ncbi:hypothetical protein FSP39_014283 [Pinctada imbricata]|uniref:CD2 antigen cytoplasmic tail-binding protein 2 n=1 Tax=Pinctada imbricata TaxID=66713 RepID=A0AA89BKJ7_PINIB|nr:hypothetical protein FSP39_014283 [Pinctada imbricata]
MSKRKSNADLLEADADDGHGSRFKVKHSLDSDEEDDAKGYEILPEDDIEGQEDATIESYEGIKVTPFNMKEELEEGHFDKEGTFIFDKQDEIKDHWMDNIDWVKVKEKEGTKDGDDEDAMDSDDDVLDEDEILKEIIKFVKPGETILKALRRLGGNKGKSQSASQRWKTKKQKVEDSTPQNAQES